MFVPQGYVSVGDAISRLNKAWLEQGKLIAPWDAAEAVGIALASKQVRCFGIVDEKGVLVEVPNNHWLTSEGRQIIAEPASRIKSIGGRSTYDILPIIPEVDFGGQFPEGGYQHAKPPTIWPEGYKTEEAELPALNYSGELGMKAPPKSRGGRQEKYDWDGFWVEVARFVYVSGIELGGGTGHKHYKG